LYFENRLVLLIVISFVIVWLIGFVVIFLWSFSISGKSLLSQAFPWVSQEALMDVKRKFSRVFMFPIKSACLRFGNVETLLRRIFSLLSLCKIVVL